MKLTPPPLKPKEIDFEALENESGLRGAGDLYQLYTFNLVTIEDAQKALKLASANSDLYERALARWVELSAQEVAAARNRGEADRALTRVPTITEDQKPLLLEALTKCASFRSTYEEVRALLTAAQNAIPFPMLAPYTLAILERLFQLAKLITHFCQLYNIVNQEPGNRGVITAANIRFEIQKRIREMCAASLKKQTLSSALTYIGQLPDALQADCLHEYIDSHEHKLTEKVLRQGLKDCYCDAFESVIGTHLDLLMCERVTKARTIKELLALRNRVKGLRKSTAALERRFDTFTLTQVIRGSSTAKATKDPLTFTEFLGGFRSEGYSSKFKSMCWSGLLGTATTPDDANVLYRLADGGSAQGQVISLWLELAGEKLSLLEDAYEKTFSAKVYQKLLLLVTNYHDALRICGLAEKANDRESYAAGFQKALSLLNTLLDRLELLASFRHCEGRWEKVAIVKRCLELAKDKDEIYRTLRMAGQLVQEEKAAAIIALAPYFKKSDDVFIPGGP